MVCQRLPRTHRHPLQALRKSFPHTNMFFPSWSLPSNGLAIRSEGCNMCPFICTLTCTCSVSILQRSITSCLLITKCLDTWSVIQRLSLAILVSNISSNSIHSSPSRLSSCMYFRPPPSTSSSDVLLGRLGLSAGGDIGL